MEYEYDNNEYLKEEGIDISKVKKMTRELIDKINEVNYCHGLEDINLTNIDFSDLTLKDMSFITFDTRTKWPSKDKLPVGYNPKELLENRKGLSLGLQTLKKEGIDGSGVKVVYIDCEGKDIFEHEEFKHLKYNYHDFVNCGDEAYHPFGVLSNLCGKNTGVAPGIMLDYYTSYGRMDKYNQSKLDVLNDILKRLEEGERFDVIGISGNRYQDSKIDGKVVRTKMQDQIDEIIFKIEKYGCTFIDGFVFENNFIGCGLNSCNKIDLNDIDYPSWYDVNNGKIGIICKGQVIARWQSINEYSYQGVNCDSWPIAQLVGVFALCRQVNKNMTYSHFVEAIYETSFSNEKGCKIIDLKALIKNLKKESIKKTHR